MTDQRGSPLIDGSTQVPACIEMHAYLLGGAGEERSLAIVRRALYSCDIGDLGGVACAFSKF